MEYKKCESKTSIESVSGKKPSHSNSKILNENTTENAAGFLGDFCKCGFRLWLHKGCQDGGEGVALRVMTEADSADSLKSGKKPTPKETAHSNFKILSEKCGLQEKSQGSYLEGNDRRDFSPLPHLSSKAELPQSHFEYIGDIDSSKAISRLNNLQADIVMMTTPQLDILQIKRSKGVKHYCHIIHSLPHVDIYEIFALDYFDSVFTNSDIHTDFIKETERVRGLKPKEIVITGCTYLDILQEKLREYQNSAEKVEFFEGGHSTLNDKSLDSQISESNHHCEQSEACSGNATNPHLQIHNESSANKVDCHADKSARNDKETLKLACNDKETLTQKDCNDAPPLSLRGGVADEAIYNNPDKTTNSHLQTYNNAKQQADTTILTANSIIMDCHADKSARNDELADMDCRVSNSADSPTCHLISDSRTCHSEAIAEESKNAMSDEMFRSAQHDKVCESDTQANIATQNANSHIADSLKSHEKQPQKANSSIADEVRGLSKNCAEASLEGCCVSNSKILNGNMDESLGISASGFSMNFKGYQARGEGSYLEGSNQAESADPLKSREKQPQKAISSIADEVRGLSKNCAEANHEGCRTSNIADSHEIRCETNLRKTILLAPSWGREALLSKYGFSLIKPFIDSDYNLIIRPHPQSLKAEAHLIDSLKEKTKHCKNIAWDSNRDNIYALNAADLMIGDFSGVIFDFVCLFEKPVITPEFHFNIIGYDLEDIYDTPWVKGALQKVGRSISVDEFHNLPIIIDSILQDEKGYEAVRASIAKMKEELWCFQGRGGEMSARAILAIQKNILEASLKDKLETHNKIKLLDSVLQVDLSANSHLQCQQKGVA